jgi:hypothetical protein
MSTATACAILIRYYYVARANNAYQMDPGGQNIPRTLLHSAG